MPNSSRPRLPEPAASIADTAGRPAQHLNGVDRSVSEQSAIAAGSDRSWSPPVEADPVWDEVIGGDDRRPNEHFIPVSRRALVDRLARPQAWQPGEAQQVKRFFRYLDYWRQQSHTSRLARLLQAYEPFAPDSDLFVTRVFTDDERSKLQAEIVAGTEDLLVQANYIKVERDDIEHLILTRESHYGLDLKVDFQVFEELLIYYRGASVKKEHRRKLSNFLRKQEFDVPIFRRVAVLFKIKPEEAHVEDVARQMRITREEARKYVRKLRAGIPAQVTPGNIYLKLFQNIPRTDIEMIFPNTQVKFRLRDKVWLGVTGGGALGTGVVGAAGKLALLFSNPITAVPAVGALGMVIVRQVMNVMNTKQKYMVVMAQNLYFHSMADNRGVLTTLADRAAEEDFKEEILLYSVLAKERVHISDLAAVDRAIESYIQREFGLDVDFDVMDAYQRLKADGILTEEPDGTLRVFPPHAAADRIDEMWDVILDRLPHHEDLPGREIDQHGNDANGASRR